jgi:hypothetical protein
MPTRFGCPFCEGGAKVTFLFETEVMNGKTFIYF